MSDPPASRSPHPVTSVLRLAGPVAVAELGWMTMQVVDTLLVRHLGASAIGAVGVGGAIFMAVASFGMGLLMGLDPLVAQAFGAGRMDDARRWLHHGLALGLAVSVLLMLLLSLGPQLLAVAGVHPDVLPTAAAYLNTLTWSLPPLLVFSASRRYLQCLGLVRPVMVALVSANAVNAVADWVLINGLWGAPRLGVVGAGWATLVSRVYMAALLLAVIRSHVEGDARGPRGRWRLDVSRTWQLVRLGLPAAAQISLEVGSFSLATMLAGRLAPASLAAHQIALNLWSLVFMVPLGVASAAAVLVGHGVGRGNAAEARNAGWSALGVAAVFMVTAGLLFLAVPGLLMRAFTSDAAVVQIGRRLLMVCAVFQLFDGMQVVATGALRGLGETRSPMAWNFAGHWCFGLPLGYFLAFGRGWDVVGLWMGLSSGLLLVGGVPSGRGIDGPRASTLPREGETRVLGYGFRSHTRLCPSHESQFSRRPPPRFCAITTP